MISGLFGKDKDALLVTLARWRTQHYSVLLEELVGREDCERRVETEILAHLNKIHEKILDPAQRQAAADSLSKLALSELTSPAFDQAKILWHQYQGILQARNVEDDQAIKWHLEEFEMAGLKKLLGPRPEKGQDAELFYQRLERIQLAVKSRISLAKQSIPNPMSFAKEIQKLKIAQAQLGDDLKHYKDILKIDYEVLWRKAKLFEKGYCSF